jgi:hypothetical protein
VETVADVVEGTVGAAVGVRHRKLLILRRELDRKPFDLTRDSLRAVVQERRKWMDVDGPRSPRHDLLAGLGQRTTRDERDSATTPDSSRFRGVGETRDCGKGGMRPVSRGRRAGRRTCR